MDGWMERNFLLIRLVKERANFQVKESVITIVKILHSNKKMHMAHAWIFSFPISILPRPCWVFTTIFAFSHLYCLLVFLLRYHTI